MADQIPIISKKNELAVWKKIKEYCEDGLAQYPTTIEEDLEILKREDLTFNQRNCVLFRHGEKEILAFLIELGDIVFKVLGEKFKDAKKIVTGLPDRFNESKDYLNELLKLVTSD